MKFSSHSPINPGISTWGCEWIRTCFWNENNHRSTCAKVLLLRLFWVKDLWLNGHQLIFSPFSNWESDSCDANFQPSGCCGNGVMSCSHDCGISQWKGNPSAHLRRWSLTYFCCNQTCSEEGGGWNCLPLLPEQLKVPPFSHSVCPFLITTITQYLSTHPPQFCVSPCGIMCP